MLNTCIASSISLRTRGSFSLTTSDYSHCSNRRSRFAYSSSTPWCSCSCNSLYTVPSCPNYCSSLYGVKQSSLIQWSSYRRPISSSFGYHARLPACGIDRMSDCDKFCNSGKRSVGKRRGVLRKCFVDNERCERYEIGGVDEAEAILNLLADDLGEEGFLPKKKSRRLVVEKRESCNVCRECGSQKNRVDVGVSVSDIRPINSSMKDVSRRRKERIPSEDSEEAILREGHKGSSLKNRREEREGVERGILFRKARERGTEEKEELLSRKHRQMVRNNDRSRTEEKEEHRQKSRKDGSSCSSYYSFSSNGNEVELAKGDYVEGSSTVIKDTREDDQRLEDYREDHLPRLANRSSSSTELGVVECEFRKKSEKRLDDIPVEEMEKRNGALLKESKSAMTYRHNNEKSSDYVSYDSRKEKPTESVGFDEERKQQHRQRDAEVSRQSETEEQTSFSHKHFETNDKRDESSTAVRGSIDNAEHQQQYHQVSCQVELKGKFQKLMKKDSKSILKRGINEPAMQEDTILASRDESDELNKVIVTHFGNTGTVWVEDRNKNKSDVPVRPPTDLQEIGTVYLGSTAETAVDDASKGSLQLGSTTSHGQPARFISDEYVIGSVDELESSSAHYVEQVRSETLISETQREKESYKTKILHGESSGDPQSNEHDLVCDNQQSGLSGAMRPSHEMSEVNKPPIKESLEADEDNARKDSDVIVKRTGRSLWNIIADIARLRWSHSESHDSGRKTGGRSSSFQSTSSEKWRNEAEENEEALEEIESTSSKRGLSGSHQPGETGSQSEESVSSSKLEGRRRNMGIDTPSSLVTQEKSSLQASTSLRSGGEISGDASFPAITDSIHLPALRMQKSPSVQVVPEAGEAGTTGLVEQIESVVNVGEVKQKKLQKKDQVVSDRFDEWEEAYRLEAEQRRVDEIFMREALSEAQKAADNWEVPVGAVLVQDGKIIARGCNLVEELRDSTAHAEIICIREASNKLRSWRLSETTLYVTLEPCPMCAGAILQARIDTLIWGAPNKLLGADGSWIRLFPGDGGNSTEVTDKPAAPVHPFHPKISIRRGVLAPECADAMQHFFKRRRKKDKKAADTSLKPPSCLPISSRPSNLMAKMHDAFTLTFCL